MQVGTYTVRGSLGWASSRRPAALAPVCGRPLVQLPSAAQSNLLTDFENICRLPNNGPKYYTTARPDPSSSASIPPSHFETMPPNNETPANQASSVRQPPFSPAYLTEYAGSKTHRDQQANDDARGELTAQIDDLLNTLSNKFAGVSSEIFAKSTVPNPKPNLLKHSQYIGSEAHVRSG